MALESVASELLEKQRGDDLAPGERRESQRPDEFLRAGRHHHLHAVPPLDQQTHQLG